MSLVAASAQTSVQVRHGLKPCHHGRPSTSDAGHPTSNNSEYIHLPPSVEMAHNSSVGASLTSFFLRAAVVAEAPCFVLKSFSRKRSIPTFLESMPATLARPLTLHLFSWCIIRLQSQQLTLGTVQVVLVVACAAGRSLCCKERLHLQPQGKRPV